MESAPLTQKEALQQLPAASCPQSCCSLPRTSQLWEAELQLAAPRNGGDASMGGPEVCLAW